MGQNFTSGLLGLAAAIVAVPVLAQTPDLPDFSNYTPEVAPTRIDPKQAPKIDGKLDDPVWETAAVIHQFYQVEPDIGLPEEDTIVYLAYDSKNLYIGMQAFDRNPDKIVRKVLDRDGEVWRDDFLRFYIDPFNTRLSGFAFDVNALGARLDRLLLPGRRPNNSWDTIWTAKTEINNQGWTAEIRIPFRSISFSPDADSWNALITREVTHTGEEIRWAGVERGTMPFNFRNPGRIVGMKDIDKGLGLDLELQGKILASRDWERPRDDDLSFEPSGNLYYKFTPALVGLLTLNSDFSDTPLDTREINTGRFSLFRQETRDFFLQDAYIFEFAGNTFSENPNGQPFFSRRIGIVEGQNVDLKFGAKLSGQFAGFDLGVLSAQMGEAPGLDSQTLSVARATRQVTPKSRLGLMATTGDPTGRTDNALFGIDYMYRASNFFGGYVQADAFYQRAFTSAEDDDSFGLRVEYPNDKWNWYVAARQVGEDFRPALGFVNRPGSRDFKGYWRRRFRPVDSFFYWYQLGTTNWLVTDIDGNVQTRRNELNVEFQNKATDEIKLSVFENREVVEVAFSLPDNLIVPAGDYQNDGVKLEFITSWQRTWGIEGDIEYKDFFGGDNLNFRVAGTMHPSRYLTFKLDYDREAISLPAGNVTIHIASFENIISLTPDVSFSTQLQYDNISESFSLFGRGRWEIRPETELFVSLGHGALIESDDFPGHFRSLQSQFVFRLGNRFQF